MRRRAFLLTGVSVLAAACADGPGKEGRLDVAPPGAGASGFAIALYRAVAAEGGNHFISPLSVSSAFALLYPGARGETAAELVEVFGFDPSPEVEAREVRTLADALRSEADSSLMSIADAAWVERSMTLRPEYAALIRDSLGATVEAVDFVADQEVALARINAWASEETRGRVPEIISGQNPDRRLVLTNAVYFKGTWKEAFAEEATVDGEFRTEDGGALPARLMRQTSFFRHIEGDGFQAADFDYVGGQFALSIFLPRRRDGLAAFERGLTGAQLEGWLEALQTAEDRFLDVTLPKLEVTADYELGDRLQALGLRRAFTPAADLSGLTEQASLMVGEVLHKSFLAVDEEGTEAAAVTAVEIVLSSARISGRPPLEFKADHPFFFVLRHTPTGTPLFLGRIASV